jgi:flagellar basal body-associated protein FliL
MKFFSRWIPVVLVVGSLIAAGIEPAAFADGTGETSKPEEQARPRVTPAVLPNRPTFTTNTAVAQVTAQRETPPITTRMVRPADAPAPPQTKSSSKKWIVIVAAAGAAVTAGFLLLGGDDEPTPTITVGAPTVGQPQ